LAIHLAKLTAKLMGLTMEILTEIHLPMARPMDLNLGLRTELHSALPIPMDLPKVIDSVIRMA
jgi:hypothetical protein